MDTNKKGEIAKLKVELMAAELGWISSRTVEGSRYDLVLDNGKKLYRTQVKYADGKSSHSDGSILVGFRKAIGDDRNKNTKYQRVKKKNIQSIRNRCCFGVCSKG